MFTKRNQHGRCDDVATVGKWCATLLAALAAGCGGASLRYETGPVAAIPHAQEGHAVVAGPIDARLDGRPAQSPTYRGRDPKEEMSQLREAVREHVAKAGLADQVAAAPSTPAEVDAVLDSARQAQAKEVVFLRFLGANNSGRLISLVSCAYCGLLPWIIVDSLPLSRHGGTGFFEAIAVDPQTRDVLIDTFRIASFGEHVNAWGYKPDVILKDMVRTSVQRALADVVAARQAGYPARTQVPNVEALVLSGRFVRVTGDRVFAPGLSFALPQGWRLEDNSKVLAKTVSPTGERFVVSWEPTWGNPEEYGDAVVAGLSKLRLPLASMAPSKLDGRPAREVVFTPQGAANPVIERITSLGGLGLIFVCGPASARTTCDQMFESVKLDGEASL